MKSVFGENYIATAKDIKDFCIDLDEEKLHS
jgi:hypothetical protein